MQHVERIKDALGVSGVDAETYFWRHAPDDDCPKGAQIDLIIDRGELQV